MRSESFVFGLDFMIAGFTRAKLVPGQSGGSFHGIFKRWVLNEEGSCVKLRLSRSYPKNRQTISH